MSKQQPKDEPVNKSKYEQHKVSLYYWIAGSLRVVEHFFDHLADAVEEAADAGAHAYKVYDKHGNICHSSDHGHHHTYA